MAGGRPGSSALPVVSCGAFCSGAPGASVVTAASSSLAAGRAARVPSRLMSFETSPLSASQQPAANGTTESTGGGNKALFLAGGFIFLVVGLFGGVIYLSRQRSQDEEAVKAMPLIPGNPVVYLDIGSNGEKVGRIVIHLRADICPKAAANFAALATGSHGFGFRSSPLHGGEKGTRIFGGDFYGNGTGGYSIYGPTFPDEDLTTLKHIGPGVVVMRNTGPDTNNSQFYITLRRLPEFDGLDQIVGFVTEGFEVLQELDKYLDTSSYGNSRFMKGCDFRIVKCGLMPESYQKPMPGEGDEATKELTKAMVAAVKEELSAAAPTAEAAGRQEHALR
jgi:peptidyl-prolyl isomerase F (cyclophilin D)